MISREKLNKLHSLEQEEILQIFHECAEALGLVDMETATKLLNRSKRRIYQLMNDNNSVKIGSHKFLFINLFLNN